MGRPFPSKRCLTYSLFKLLSRVQTSQTTRALLISQSTLVFLNSASASVAGLTSVTNLFPTASAVVTSSGLITQSVALVTNSN